MLSAYDLNEKLKVKVHYFNIRVYNFIFSVRMSDWVVKERRYTELKL